MKQLKITALVPGMILAKDVLDITGRLILNRESKFTHELVKKLEYWGINEVWVEEPSHTIKEQQEELVAPKISAAHNRVIDIAENILSEPELKEVDPNLLRGMVGDIGDQINLNINVLLNLSHLKTYDNYLFSHVVNVCLLAQIIGKELNLGGAELKELGLAALLHDVGMVKLDRSIYGQNRRLTPEEWEAIKRHPDDGFEMLKETGRFSDDVLHGVRQHHERCDGSGYPQGLKEPEMYIYGNIIAVADVYDACISPRTHRQRLTPHAALKNLLGESHLFDVKILKAFIASMMIYPIGSFVKLNTGEMAKVVGINHLAPFRPEIRILIDRMGTKLDAPIRINLSDEDYTQTYIEEIVERDVFEKIFGTLDI